MEACAVICRKATVALLDANPFIFEHINGIFVRFWPSGPLFSGISSTKSGFLCSFIKLDVGLGDFPAERGIAAPAQPLCHLPSPVAAYCRCCRWSPLHLRSRRICAAAVPSAVACSRLPPVLPVLPLLPPLHLLSRFTCGAAAPAQPILPQPTPVAPDGACGLWYHSGLGGGVEDIVD